MTAHNAIRRIISTTRIFEGLSTKDLDTISSFCQVKRFEDGDKILQEGLRGDDLFIIARGSVEIVKNAPNGFDEKIALLHAGDTFGEVSLIDNEPRSATVIAIGNCKLIRIAKKDIESLACVNEIYKNMARMLTYKLRSANVSLITLLHAGEFLRDSARAKSLPSLDLEKEGEDEGFDPDIFGIDGEEFAGKETLLGMLRRHYAAFKLAYPDLDLWDLGSWELIAEDPHNPPGHRRDADGYLIPLEKTARALLLDKQTLHNELMRNLFN